jgi:uncharacterized membrane protein
MAPDRPTRESQRLDQPREANRSLFTRPQVDPDTFGRFAEKFARYMGTANFLVYMTVFVLVWIGANAIGIYRYKWDAYPFIFLTLLLSLQASYAAPLILLAQNRQTDRDRVALEQDRASYERNLADTEFLTREVAALRIALRDMATRDFLRSELRSLLDEMQDHGMLRSTDERPFGSGDGAPKALDGPRLT